MKPGIGYPATTIVDVYMCACNKLINARVRITNQKTSKHTSPPSQAPAYYSGNRAHSRVRVAPTSHPLVRMLACTVHLRACSCPGGQGGAEARTPWYRGQPHHTGCVTSGRDLPG
jgi:hypothetical protein